MKGEGGGCRVKGGGWRVEGEGEGRGAEGREGKRRGWSASHLDTKSALSSGEALSELSLQLID